MNGVPHSVTAVAFAIVALASVASALAVITRRSPVAAIAWLVVHFVATACAYVLLASQFIAAVQVLVYAGAIIVLFLFVVMLLALDGRADPASGSGLGRKVLVAVLGLGLVTLVGRIRPARGPAAAGAVDPAVEDSVAWLASNLFSAHLVAFEVASIVLIAAMAGIMVYTTRRVPAGAPDGGGKA